MRSSYPYFAVTVAIGVIGAVFVAFTTAHPRLMTFVIFWLLLPFVMFFFLGVVELVWGHRLGGGPGGPGLGLLGTCRSTSARAPRK